MNLALDLRALKYATQRVEDFTLVHKQSSSEERTEALTLWFEYLGLTDDIRDALDEWMTRFSPAEKGGMMIGFILGLFYLDECNNPRPK